MSYARVVVCFCFECRSFHSFNAWMQCYDYRHCPTHSYLGRIGWLCCVRSKTSTAPIYLKICRAWGRCHSAPICTYTIRGDVLVLQQWVHIKALPKSFVINTPCDSSCRIVWICIPPLDGLKPGFVQWSGKRPICEGDVIGFYATCCYVSVLSSIAASGAVYVHAQTMRGDMLYRHISVQIWYLWSFLDEVICM